MLELFIEVCKLFQDKVMLNKKKEKKKKKENCALVYKKSEN